MRHTLISLQRVLVGFAAGTLLGFATGVALGLSRTLEAYVLPSFNALVQIPVLGWLPFLLLLVGVGEPLKYLLIAHAALVPVTLSTLQGFRQTPPALDEVASVFGYTRRQRIVHVVLPAAIPTLATGVRLAFTKSWLALVVVGFVASSEGRLPDRVRAAAVPARPRDGGRDRRRRGRPADQPAARCTRSALAPRRAVRVPRLKRRPCPRNRRSPTVDVSCCRA